MAAATIEFAMSFLPLIWARLDSRGLYTRAMNNNKILPSDHMYNS